MNTKKLLKDDPHLIDYFNAADPSTYELDEEGGVKRMGNLVQGNPYRRPKLIKGAIRFGEPRMSICEALGMKMPGVSE